MVEGVLNDKEFKVFDRGEEGIWFKILTDGSEPPAFNVILESIKELSEFKKDILIETTHPYHVDIKHLLPIAKGNYFYKKIRNKSNYTLDDNLYTINYVDIADTQELSELLYESYNLKGSINYVTEELIKVFNNEYSFFLREFSYKIIYKEKIIGVLITVLRDNEPFILHFAVNEAHRDNGLATNLLYKLQNCLLNSKYDRVVCFIHENNIKSKNFFSKIGYYNENSVLNIYILSCYLREG